MLRHRPILARLLLSTITFVLICGISSAGIPECLMLINDTANDLTIRKVPSCLSLFKVYTDGS
jgi:hypothetical protein